MRKMTHIIISGKSYPIIIDLNVLEYIQNEYGSIHKFERDLIGVHYKKDMNGNQEYTEDGKPQMYITEPSIKAIKMVLPAMINEGLEIEAEEKDRNYEKVTEKQIFRNCNVDFNFLSDIIHSEYKRCFEIKKA